MHIKAIHSAFLAVWFLFMVSCSSHHETSTNSKIKVEYWYLAGANAPVPVSVALFNERQDSIEVVPVAIPWKEHEKKVLTAILSGNPPDLINMVTPISKWASRMALIPIDSLLVGADVTQTDFFAANWKDVSHQGKAYGMPMYTASYAFFYNKAHFREVGLDPERPPRTWDELQAMARRLDLRDGNGRIRRLGFLPDYGNLHMPMLMAWQNGAEFVRGDTIVMMHNKELLDALAWVHQYYSEYGLEHILGFRAGLGMADQQGFISGRLSMMVLDNTFVDQLERYAPNLDYGVAVIPTWEGRDTAGSTGTWWVGIPRGAKHVDAAWAFLQFAASEECQTYEALTMKENLFPANRKTLESGAFLNVHPTRDVFVDMLAFAVSPVVVPMAHDVFWREYTVARDQTFYGRQSPETAFTMASIRVQRELREALEYDSYVRANMDIEWLTTRRKP
jgi:multiple sugar transport system substrate-binding protein